MKIAFPLAVLAVLSACEVAAPDAPNVAYRPEEAGTVDHALCLLGFTAIALREARTTGHHLVDAEVNGRKGVFLVDTGANLSVIDSDHAAAFGIGDGPSLPGGATGVRSAGRAAQVRIDSMRIGTIPIRQSRIVITDLGQIGDALAPLAGGAVHGLIGQDALKEHRAVIDVERPLLYIMEEDHDPAPVPSERCRPAAAEKQS